MEKKSYWQSIHDILSSQNLDNIILARDLNITLNVKEKKGGSIVWDPLREMVEDIMSNWDLEDIKPSRGKFTWLNRRIGPGHIAARLDRFLIHHSFATFGFRSDSKILPFNMSDHKPILLDLTEERNLGPIPFRFSPSWIYQAGFMDLVASS